MSRIRTIKPDTFISETLAKVSLEAERTFIGLWTQADDEGRFRDRPAVLNGALWPWRTEHGVNDLKNDLDQLTDKELVCRYEVDNVSYAHLPSWHEHQKINRPTESKIPKCPSCPEISKKSDKKESSED